MPGTLRDSIFVLEGLLEQETGLNQENRLPPGSDFRRWVWITIA
ncbi:hypothetical protein, partial [Escherichia coli]